MGGPPAAGGGPRYASRGGQCPEVESAVPPDDELAVDHRAGLQLLEGGSDDLGDPCR